ncbi:hypothetical protein WJX84_010639 [Apatococcus fuscideae]|uniref:Bromo domain-containing protein n=1 Tax=Apatococcus fuscideae TaxID=2026836 RepID=A0AAW1T0Q5_9CHLO
MDQDHKKRAHKALRTLMAHEIAISYFNEPVDADGLGIPEYLDVIKRPMDLGTVAHKLQADKYRSLVDFRADINLIWRNCQAFNEPGSNVFEESKDLAAVFEQLWTSSGLAKLEQAARSTAEAAWAAGKPGRASGSQQLLPQQRQRQAPMGSVGHPSRGTPIGDLSPPWPQGSSRVLQDAYEGTSARAQQRSDAARSRHMLDLATGAVSRGLDDTDEPPGSTQGRGRAPQTSRRTSFDSEGRLGSEAAPPRARSAQASPMSGQPHPAVPRGPAGTMSEAGRASQKFMQLSSFEEHRSGSLGGQAKAARAAHPLHRCLNVIQQLLQDPDVVHLLDHAGGASRGAPGGLLGQVRAALLPGLSNGWGTVAYKSTGEVLADVRPIFHAAMSKFKPHSQEWSQCRQVEEVFDAGWLQAGLSFDTPSQAGAQQRTAGRTQGSLEAAAQGLKRRASAMSAEQSEEEAGAGGPPKLARRPRSQRPSREPRPVQRDMLDDLDPGDGNCADKPDGDRAAATDGLARPCEVCRRAKKGKCGSWTSPLACLKRPHNGLPSRPIGTARSRSQETSSLPGEDSSAVQSALNHSRGQAEQQQQGTRLGLRRGLASQASASRGNAEGRPQGPGPPPGLEGFPWPLTKQAAAELGLPEPDPQKEAAEAEAIAAWQRLRRQRRKLPELEAAAVEGARKLAEAQALLAAAIKAEDAAEAERQAALALEPWPPDARIVSSTIQPQAPMQGLHRDVASLGAYLLAAPAWQTSR